jgi:hypothetical protein
VSRFAHLVGCDQDTPGIKPWPEHFAHKEFLRAPFDQYENPFDLLISIV